MRLLFAAKILSLVMLGEILAGCTNRLILPKQLSLTPSGLDGSEFRYLLTIRAQFHLRFNVHRFEFDDYYSPETFKIYLKNDVGILHEKQFAVNSARLPAPARGTIAIDGSCVKIEVYALQNGSEGNGGTWVPSFLNGVYIIEHSDKGTQTDL